MKIRNGFGIAVVAACFGCAVVGMEHGDDDDEKEISLSEVPKVVIEAAQKEVKGIKLEEAEVEVEDGQTVYELEGEADGKEYEIEVTAAGKVLEVESEDDDDDDDDK